MATSAQGRIGNTRGAKLTYNGEHSNSQKHSVHATMIAWVSMIGTPDSWCAAMVERRPLCLVWLVVIGIRSVISLMPASVWSNCRVKGQKVCPESRIFTD